MKIGILLIILTSALFSQTKNADEILSKIKDKFEIIEDYEVNINIIVDMEFLRIPNVSAKVYFKQPDKMKMDSKDFAVLPKEAISFSPVKFLKGNISSIYVKSDTLDNTEIDIIKIIPLDDSSNIILSSLWVDVENTNILKIETTTKNKGTFTADFYYGEMIEHGLPSKMIFNFNIAEPKLPEMLKMETGDIKKPLGKISKNLAGNIEIRYSNYKINQGIEDSFFEKDNSK